MPHLDSLIEKIIPGISTISREEQDLFFQSEEGAALSRFIKTYHCSPPGLLSTGYASALNRNKRHNDILAFRRKIEESASFISLRVAIVRVRLNDYFWYQFLNQDEQAILASRPYSIAYYNQSLDLNAWVDAMHQDDDARIIQIHHQMHNKRSQLLLQAKKQIGCILNPSLSSDDLEHLIKIMYHPQPSSENKKTLLHRHLSPLHNSSNVWNQRGHFDWSISSALSSLARNVGLTNIKQYMDRIADAHTFYQFFGLSAEHGGWQLDSLDLYNYTRNQENISALKKVLYALIKPQHAFFHEYVQIARYEKNALSIIIRVLIPILVVALFLVLTFELIAPLVISELLEFLMFFPALYLSMGAASAYVELKNQAYTNFVVWWWGDIYKTPAFQVNPRLIESFHGAELAQSIADFYILSLKECDQIEREYALIPKGTLTSKQLSDQNDVIVRKSMLLLEWYDLHSHDDLGCDETSSIIKDRLRIDGLYTHKQLKKDTSRYVDLFVDELRDNLSPPIEPQIIEATRWPFFNQNRATIHLGEKCAAHYEKIACIDSIYSQLGAHP